MRRTRSPAHAFLHASQDITVVTERSDADFRDAFDRQDADRSGQVDKRQLRALLADALGREPGELHLIKFSAALARTKVSSAAAGAVPKQRLRCCHGACRGACRGACGGR